MSGISPITDIIRRKRDGHALTADEIGLVVRRLADGSLPREQAAALAMAIFLNDMDARETAALTAAMARSGTMIDWTGRLDGPVLDKHSTGGVGDKVSLMLAPIIAACGGFVPMIAGRGLGHTGGTIDKLQSIPGYDPFAGIDRFQQVVADVGCSIVGQTDDLAPADRMMYAIRDVTATIESTPLITGSILSKKLAAGLDGLVMDIKAGSGAFMSDDEEARALGNAIIASAREAGLPARALVTDMDETLGHAAGNALEVMEAVAYLRGDVREARLHGVTVALCAEVLVIGGLASDIEAAEAKVEAVLANGAAAERFSKMIAALGGPADLFDRPEAHLAAAPVIRPVPAPASGWLAKVDGKAVGEAIIDLGGGRRRVDDVVDPRTGFADVAAIGTRFEVGDPVAFAHAASEDAANRAVDAYLAACTFDDARPADRPLVRMVLGR
ncbi:thymidine phosphorylase [Sphingomonas montanisoli]|uniref:Thymidine phosphorylase n=1 Tax=Sphingomonas montanisoli TaxID=2606412 RepID=A0A5D9C780_9SPHN|nr:thymidine phosphorylase [Sphingomonas montanisoli]TZG27539.1 thymidine phosphorylase [Sphingomonas montanisoli]